MTAIDDRPEGKEKSFSVTTDILGILRFFKKRRIRRDIENIKRYEENFYGNNDSEHSDSATCADKDNI